MWNELDRDMTMGKGDHAADMHLVSAQSVFEDIQICDRIGGDCVGEGSGGSSGLGDGVELLGVD